jgi:exodeoxyribonuclease III
MIPLKSFREACMLRFLMVLITTMAFANSVLADTHLKILTFNIWGGGGQDLERTIAVLRASEADVISLQEVYRRGEAGENPKQKTLTPEIAASLGFHYHDQKQSSVSHGVTAVLSRYPITGHNRSGLGVRIDVDGHDVTIFNLHLEDAPYQPYQLVGIPYADAPFLQTAEEAIISAQATRGRTLNQLEKDLKELDDANIIITGDFNEPSHRDWTMRAASIKRHPHAVVWPTTKRIESWGFKDAYREIFPDEITHPGVTWTNLPGTREHHDRIDFIFARGPNMKVQFAAVVGEKTPHADRVISPWPSDHRAILATVSFGLPTAVTRVSSAPQ